MKWLSEKVHQNVGKTLNYNGRYFGIEIEMEPSGKSFGEYTLPVTWIRAPEEGSINPNGMELVLAGAQTKQEIMNSLDALAEAIPATKVALSPRTGVHVHINVGHMTVNELLTFLTLYYMMEENLLHKCGASRKGNFFCLTLEEASVYRYWLEQALRDQDLRKIDHNGEYRYVAMNLHSIKKYCSLEFRGIQTPKDQRDNKYWIELFDRMMDVASTRSSPLQFIEDYSILGGDALLNELGWPIDETSRQLLQNGVWQIQTTIFRTEWK